MNSISYYLTDFWDELGDQRVNNWPLMSGGPWKIILVVLAFVYFVKILGPRLMKNREPFDLRSAILLHNSCLIGFNGAGFFVGLWITNWGLQTTFCEANPVVDSEYHLKEELMLYFGYCYMISKIADFADTVFFILRKKFHQASFLHVFHHALMPFAMWLGVRIHPRPYSGFMALINTLVHTVMYSYYALACAGSEMKRFLWWKKHITQLQLLQFVLIFFHGVHGIINPDCKFPKFLAFMESFYAAFFFVLFFRFYRRAYGGGGGGGGHGGHSSSNKSAVNSTNNSNVNSSTIRTNSKSSEFTPLDKNQNNQESLTSEDQNGLSRRKVAST